MASDAELIGRSLAGDGQAFMEVICRHEGAVGAYLARRAGREAAEDLLGEVWVAAFESRGTYDRSFAGARPWLYGVALNRLRRYWRSRPAEDLVPDVTSLGCGWDPWPAVDARVDTQAVLRAALDGPGGHTRPPARGGGRGRRPGAPGDVQAGVPGRPDQGER